MRPKRKYVDMINEKLLVKRTSEDVSISLNIPEHKFKKHAEKLNWALMEVYDETKSLGTMMSHLVLSLQDYFDVVWLYENVLSDSIKAMMIPEMSSETGLKVNTNKSPKPDEISSLNN